ncbi:14390_t:CDS:2 [Entrophospora sp. SA101]|nr:7754_t:CDS:2 [Entrophospora sp. SA101]CAJ0625451.1 14390_t:CDS:2 [Entrophospora sp. SA101]CAJ0891421.1 8544_t:CDS:2 [Entrophospora sp. SA101]CAJ0891493.1 8550_t:CDS:2 [Entrophospora sp. SA101]CAJ0907197.1 6983_t:CDS:2 [Entrophospora sp. SA101]
MNDQQFLHKNIKTGKDLIYLNSSEQKYQKELACACGLAIEKCILEFKIKSVHLWNARTEEVKTLAFTRSGISSLFWSEDGDYFAVGLMMVIFKYGIFRVLKILDQ